MERSEWDRALTLIEAEITPGRMRQVVMDRLRTPEEPDLDLHRALLEIASARDGWRLVTTNFDDLFANSEQELPLDAAPKLPMPKPHKWRSLVHLHGSIREPGPDGENLVLTSADFGTAYLTERWASRFVTELFRYFKVLFVGYRVNDPVMRYLVDALAAERHKDASIQPAFAFAPVGPAAGDREAAEREWRAKGLSPIFYDDGEDHRLLAETLKEWASLCRGGLASRRNLVLSRTRSVPAHSGHEDARLVVWGLSEPSGSIAHAFAAQKPPPSAEWLQIFDDSTELPEGEKLLSLPDHRTKGQGANESHPAAAALVDRGGTPPSPWALSPVTRALGTWLTHHLQDRTVLEWALARGGVLHPELRRTIRRRLAKATAESGPPAPLKKLWALLSSESFAERSARHWSHPDLGDLRKARPGDPVLRADLLRLLATVPVLRPVSDSVRELRRIEIPAAEEGEMRPSVRDLVEVDMRLSGGDIAGLAIDQLLESPHGAPLVLEIVWATTSLLQEALDWLAALDHADAEDDPGWYLSSLEDGPGARREVHHHPWLRLTQLALVGFRALAATDLKKAKGLQARWLDIDYPLFRRMVLQVAGEYDRLHLGSVVNMLLAHNARLLWADSILAEELTFFRKAGHRIPSGALRGLVRRILQGPPQPVSTQNPYAEGWEEGRARMIGKRLLALREAGAPLPSEAALLAREHEQTRQRAAATREPEPPPLFLQDLEELAIEDLLALVTSEDGRPRSMRAWQELARSHPEKATQVLTKLAGQGRWEQPVWRCALHGLADAVRAGEKQPLWAQVSRLLDAAPRELMEEEFEAVTYWVQAIPRRTQRSEEELLWPLWDRLLEHALQRCERPPSDDDQRRRDAVSEAINHPVGHLTEALLSRLWARKPERRDLLPEDLEPRLTRLATGEGWGYELARVILASALYSLFTIDPSWAQRHLLPKLDWQRSPEAPSLWAGYLSQPRIDPDLLAALKPWFLDTLRRPDELGDCRADAFQLFALTCIHFGESWTRDEIRSALTGMPPGDLAGVVETLGGMLEDAGEDRSRLWSERIGPWLQDHWPENRDQQTPETAAALARAAMAAGDAFPNAVTVVWGFLLPLDDRHGVDHEINDSDLPQRFPWEILQLLDKVVPDDVQSAPWAWHDLREILDKILEAQPDLRETREYRRLDEVLQRTGL